MHRAWPAGQGSLRRTLIAAGDGAVVGVGTLFENTFHPRRLMVVVNVAGGWRRRGIGSALFDALAQLGDGRPWLAKITRRDRAGMAFLAGRGFRPAINTLTGVLDPRREPVRVWLATLPAVVPGYRVIPFDDPACPASLAEVALVHAAVYRQFHQWNPPVEEDAAMALAHHCGPDVVAGSHLCAYAGDGLVGAANLIADPFHLGPDRAYLVNAGVVGADRPGARDITAALVRRSLEFAAARDLRVTFEVDDTYVHHQALFELAPVTEIDRDFTIVANG